LDDTAHYASVSGQIGRTRCFLAYPYLALRFSLIASPAASQGVLVNYGA